MGHNHTMTLDVTVERETTAGEMVLDTFEDVLTVMNVPGVGKVKLTFADDSTATEPCASIVRVNTHEVA